MENVKSDTAINQNLFGGETKNTNQSMKFLPHPELSFRSDHDRTNLELLKRAFQGNCHKQTVLSFLR